MSKFSSSRTAGSLSCTQFHTHRPDNVIGGLSWATTVAGEREDIVRENFQLKAGIRFIIYE